MQILPSIEIVVHPLSGPAHVVSCYACGVGYLDKSMVILLLVEQVPGRVIGNVDVEVTIVVVVAGTAGHGENYKPQVNSIGYIGE